MHEDIELTFESPDGVIDCRLEPQTGDDDVLRYSATLLYPNVVNGFSRSEIYCHMLVPGGKNGAYIFDRADEDIHPKIKKWETKIAAAIAAEQRV